MTTADYPAFTACFTGLARTQGGPDDPDSIDAYFETLKDLPFNAIRAAALDIGRTGGAWFPKAAQWHEAALAVQRATIEPAYVPPGGRDEPWRNECEDCRDTGWIERWVEKGELRLSQAQGREIPAMYRHQVASPCPCRAVNRTYQRLHKIAAPEDDEPPPDRPRRTGKSRGWQKL